MRNAIPMKVFVKAFKHTMSFIDPSTIVYSTLPEKYGAKTALTALLGCIFTELNFSPAECQALREKIYGKGKRNAKDKISGL